MTIIHTMATSSKFCTLLGLLPEVRCAKQLTHRQKVAYTMISLVIFLTASQIPLYGIQFQPGTKSDPLCWGNLFWALNDSSLLTLGITPILVPEIMKQFLVASKRMNVDCNSPEAHTLLNRMQKLMGILTAAIFGAVTSVLNNGAVGKFGAGNAALIALQILFSGIIIIYLDDVLKKGYGLVPCISLLTAANVCGNVLWKALSPMYFRYHGKGIEYEGAVLAWIHLLITRRDKLSAMREAFCRQNLPNVINLLATCFFVPIAIFFQGLSIALPIRVPNLRGFQTNYLIKISNISYGSIIFYRMLATNLYTISKLLYMNYGGNTLINHLGTWKGSKQPIPDGGIVYYIAAPPTLSDLHRDPLHAFVYVIFVLVACAVVAVSWVRVCFSSKRFRDGFLVLKEERIMLADPDSVPLNELMSHVVKAACFGGLCVGALIILGDFIGVFGSGTGVMLAVTTLYPYFNGRAVDVSVFGF